MRIAVVGIEGQVARSLQAARSDHEVIAVGRPGLDLTQPSTVLPALAALAPAVVVNAAAYTAVDKAEAEPELAFAVNAMGAGAVAEAAAACGAPLIHISTDYVFDGSSVRPYLESDPVAPLGTYGRSKLDGERRVAATWAKHVILRTAWVHSPYGNNFVKTMLRLAASRPEIAVVDDQIGNPTFAPHLAAAVLTIADRIAEGGDTHWGIYHATGAGETTWCGLARETFAVSARLGGPTAMVKAITTAEYPTPARRPANSRLDGSRLGEVYGVHLPHWREGVAASVAALIGSAG